MEDSLSGWPEIDLEVFIPPLEGSPRIVCYSSFILIYPNDYEYLSD